MHTVAHQAPLCMEFSRQEYWSVLSFPSPGDFPDPQIEPGSPALQVDSLPSEPPGKPQMKLALVKSNSTVVPPIPKPGPRRDQSTSALAPCAACSICQGGLGDLSEVRIHLTLKQ